MEPRLPSIAFDRTKVMVVGAGVNGLVCALQLARSGFSVQLVEDRAGTLRTEFPFPRAPALPTFTGVHRLGFIPRELVSTLGLGLPLSPRGPSMFVPTTTEGRFLLAGPRDEGQPLALEGIVSERDSRTLAAMHAELDAIVADLAPAWLRDPIAIEEAGDRWVRPALRQAFVALCRGSLAGYLARFGLENELLTAAITADALGGSFLAWDAPGSGAPLLVRHAATSASGGADAVAVGGMSALTRVLRDAVRAAGVKILADAAVTQILVEGNTTTGVLLADGRTLPADAVVSSADPERLGALVGTERFTAEYTRRIETFARTGGVAKLNVAFTDLPRFTCLPEPKGQHGATIFLLPGGENGAMRVLTQAFAEATAGRVPGVSPVECIFPSAADESLRDPAGRHSASLLVPWTPYDVDGTTWEAEEERFTASILAVLEAFAPGATSLVADTVLFHPKKLEAHYGVTRGHLGHIDDTLLFGDRLSATTPIRGLYSCGRGCGPAGGAFGVAGLIAARRVVADTQIALERTELNVND